MIGSRARFPKPLELYKPLLFFGDNIVASEHNEWKRYRKISAPAFTEVRTRCTSFLVRASCCNRLVKPNNKLVWDETIRVINDLFDNVWGNQDEITVDHILEVFMPVRCNHPYIPFGLRSDPSFPGYPLYSLRGGFWTSYCLER